MLAHKLPKATEFCLRSVRKFYNNKIIVFESGSNQLESICHKYDCQYFYEPINYQKITPESKYVLMSDLEDFKILLNQLNTVCDLCESKWLVYLEPDIVIRNHIENVPEENFAAGGNIHDFNTFEPFETQTINKYRKEKKLPLKDKYVFSAPMIYNRDILKKILKTDIEEKIQYALDNCPKNTFLELRALDAFMSFLFFINGYEIKDWDQVVEIYHPENEHRLVFAPMVHQFKHFYS
tara:strand:+ start:308 stop:1018 length:711 start_codon:yes stop_codon:yes gene_type:complete